MRRHCGRDGALRAVADLWHPDCYRPRTATLLRLRGWSGRPSGGGPWRFTSAEDYRRPIAGPKPSIPLQTATTDNTSPPGSKW